MKRFILLILLAPSFSFANGVGNGGGAFICPDPTQSEFLDLYEARRPVPEAIPIKSAYFSGAINPRAALNIPASSSAVEDQIQAAFGKLKADPILYESIMATYQAVKNATINPLPPGVQLAWPSDADTHYIKAGCQALGIMIFYDDNLAMDQDSQSLHGLPNTDQAAAWVHETIYRFARMTSEGYDTNSVRSRAIVGHLFSDESPDQLKTSLANLGLFLSNETPKFFRNVGEAGTAANYVLGSESVNAAPTLTVNYQIAVIPDTSCRSMPASSGSYTMTTGERSYEDLFYMGELTGLLHETPGYNSKCKYEISLADNNGSRVTLTQSHVWDRVFIFFFFPGLDWSLSFQRKQ